jgi:hypothetical protein
MLAFHASTLVPLLHDGNFQRTFNDLEKSDSISLSESFEKVISVIYYISSQLPGYPIPLSIVR